MATGVSLWFDDRLEAQVRSLWREVAEAGVSDDLHRGPYRPHLTLGVWEHADTGAVARLLTAESHSLPRARLSFASVRSFNSPPSVVYLAPEAEAALRELQARTHALLREHVSDALRFQSPGDWTPHCTIAWNLIDPAQAIACRRLCEIRLPLRGEGVALGIIDTPAEIELHRISMGTV